MFYFNSIFLSFSQNLHGIICMVKQLKFIFLYTILVFFFYVLKFIWGGVVCFSLGDGVVYPVRSQHQCGQYNSIGVTVNRSEYVPQPLLPHTCFVTLSLASRMSSLHFYLLDTILPLLSYFWFILARKRLKKCEVPFSKLQFVSTSWCLCYILCAN